MYNPDRLLDAKWNDEPFPHTVIDGLWDSDALQRYVAEFPAANDPRWITYDDPEEVGKKAGASNMWGPATHEFFEIVRSDEFVKLMEEVTQIRPLKADDIGGGMHETGEGGRLEMHIDFNVHPSDPSLERRLNMLVFLNEEWEADWGGVLHLGSKKEISVMPMFNRTVIFECSDDSFHGHPEPIVGNHLRRSLACYYYAPIREGVLEKAHTTLWNRD